MEGACTAPPQGSRGQGARGVRKEAGAGTGWATGRPWRCRPRPWMPHGHGHGAARARAGALGGRVRDARTCAAHAAAWPVAGCVRGARGGPVGARPRGPAGEGGTAAWVHGCGRRLSAKARAAVAWCTAARTARRSSSRPPLCAGGRADGGRAWLGARCTTCWAWCAGPHSSPRAPLCSTARADWSNLPVFNDDHTQHKAAPSTIYSTSQNNRGSPGWLSDPDDGSGPESTAAPRGCCREGSNPRHQACCREGSNPRHQAWQLLRYRLYPPSLIQ
jgi:hypothetical protein